MHINPTIMIPITIGSYPILDEPPSYAAAVNTIVPSVDTSINLNTNETHSNANLRSALSAILNNEQVVRPQSTVPAFDDAKTADVDVNAPYPHYGKSAPYTIHDHMCLDRPVTYWHNL